MNTTVTRRRTMSAVIALAIVIGLSTSVAAKNLNPGVVPPKATPSGASYGEWGARWWQWALSAPVSQNPLLDTTGENCGFGQTGHVWFLGGTLGSGAVVRTCEVPVGKALFFPILNATFIATEEGETEALAHTSVTNRVNDFDVSLLAVEVDGESLQGLGSYRAHSPTFFVTLPQDNLFGAPPGTYGPAAADGYWIMLSPLSPGQHTIHIYGVFPGGGVLDVTYNLTVVHP